MAHQAARRQRAGSFFFLALATRSFCANILEEIAPRNSVYLGILICPVPDEPVHPIENTLEKIHSENKLNKLIRKAATVADLKEFEKTIEK